MPTRSNAIKGRVNKANGQAFEQLIDRACQYYQEAGLADICKVPEPVRQLGRVDGKGHFLACYAKRAQPDYQGTLAGGTAVVFEAKLTTKDRIQQAVVLPWQAEALERHAALGATCFVLVAFYPRDFFRVPWNVWRDMKQDFGHMYLTPQEILQYQIAVKGNGVLRFLDGLMPGLSEAGKKS